MATTHSSITTARGGLEIVEEAIHLLRRAPLRIWALFLIGAAPFWLAFTYFIADMSRSAFAGEQLLASSLGLALAFAWKQCWQAVFAAELYCFVEGGSVAWTWPRVWRMASMQCALQPFSLILLPLSAITIFPFPAVLGGFRNLTLYAGLGRAKPIRQARQQAQLWVAQAWAIVFVFLLLGLLLFVNYLATLATVPQLLKSFIGLDNSLTRYTAWVLNGTVMTAVAVLVYLTLDPLLDAAYVLRCFYGESIATGTDLRAGLRRTLSALALLSCLCGNVPAQGVKPTPPTATIDQQRLKQAIDETVRRREFAWNVPRTATERNESQFAGWVRSFWTGVRRGITSIWKWIERIFFPDETLTETGGRRTGATTAVRWLLIALGVVFGLLILYIFYRQRKAQSSRVIAKPVLAIPVIDLKDESVAADQLAEDGWYALANECIGKGDYRLALRALYLGAISHLGRRELVVIQRWKSGVDYSREVARRARGTPEVAPAFARTVLIFESGWYGRHTVDREMLERFTAGFEEVRRHAR